MRRNRSRSRGGNKEMAAIPPVLAASPGGSDVSIGMPAPVAVAAAGDVVPQPREGKGCAAADPKPEMHLGRFVRCVAFGEWAGNAFGALAFAWATVILLGGFCSSLNRQDFWFASVVIFIEALRIFSRSYKLDSHYLFGTTRALRWIKSSFTRMLVRPQEGDQVVLAMGLWLNLIAELILLFDNGIAIASQFILYMALLVPWSRRPPRLPGQWQMRAVAIAYILLAVYTGTKFILSSYSSPQIMVSVIIEAGAVALLLLNMRRPRGLIANLTTTPCGRRLISLAKVASALWLATEILVYMCYAMADESPPPILPYILNLDTPFTILVLSLGSLQNDLDADTTCMFGRWTDAILHIFFIFHFLVPFPVILLDGFIVPDLSPVPCASLSLVLLLLLLLIGNLQIPAALAQIVLSSLRLSILRRDPHMGYDPLPAGSSPNMVVAIALFYVLALCQGSLYIMASFLALLSLFPRRWLMRRFKLGGKLGAKAIDLYYKRAYATRMEMGMFGAAGSTMTFDDFAVESLSSGSSSRELQVAGLCVLHNMLQEPRRDDCRKDLLLRVTSSSTAVSTLVGMLAWTDVGVEDDDSYHIIRLLAARVTAKLAGSLRISSIPGILKLVSSLLKLAENTNDVVLVVPNQTPLAIANGGSSSVQLAQGSSNGRGWCSRVCLFWQSMKQDYWSVPEKPATLSHQDSPPVLGMAILKKLARDLDNCAEIFKDDTANLISKTIGLIGLATSDSEQNDALVCSSLEFLRRLATTGERIGAALRRELWNHPFLLTSLARVLEDDRSSSPHQVWEPAMDIIAKLALDSAAGHEIGRSQVITERLLHAFLGRHGPTNTYYDQSLQKVSGEALANLALWGTANCSAILDERGYQVINDLKNMLSDDKNRYVAASLLLNLCAHCHSVNMLLSHPHASEHLSSALSTVMEHTMAAEGKQLESLINLASEIGDVVHEAFVRELESQTNSGAELVQKLLYALNSKKIPNPEYPRMRRVIVKILISILESCRRSVEKLMEEGVMEWLMQSLNKIERTPSRVEEYRVFYGNIGVVLEDGEPMSTLVARAKALLVQRTTQTAEAQSDRR